MAKPWVHAKNSARKFGGVAEDYIEIHNLMDSTKGCLADNRHRALTHNSWFISADGPLERIFGVVITNSDGKEVSVRDIGEQHILEDFGMRFIPTPQDYLEGIPLKSWMNNGKNSVPPSFQTIEDNKKTTKIDMNDKEITEKDIEDLINFGFKIDSKGILYYPNDESNNWAACWKTINYKNLRVSVPHWVFRRRDEILNETNDDNLRDDIVVKPKNMHVNWEDNFGNPVSD